MTIDTHWLGEQSPLGIFDDVTVRGEAGDARYDAASQHYALEQGSGETFVWKRMDGDFIIQARIDAGDAANLTRGLAVRGSLDADGAPAVDAFVSQWSTVLKAHEEAVSDAPGDDVLQLERAGDTFTLRAAAFGVPFRVVGTTEVAFDGPVYAGLFVAGVDGGSCHFQNVRVVVPANAESNHYRNPLGSHLEVLDVQAGTAQIIYSSATNFEAPNWTHDSRALIYNSQGRLYRFDLATGTPEVIDTGFAVRSNNDHVLSFDGTLLGISDHTEDGHSIVYVVPTTGGTPRRVTALGPSYFHGWSPDGRWLVYTGARDGEYDIYRISVDGGEEERLTTAPGLDDGSEYTPDGQFIYFNSVRSGSMQIWRMAADGSDQTQITDDEFNNWFAHVGPDGTEIVFISYGAEVAPGDHPPYKHVYLRRMALDGGAPTVVAYLYGGQGTINVPSWSPDGRHVAYVSNTRMD